MLAALALAGLTVSTAGSAGAQQVAISGPQVKFQTFTMNLSTDAPPDLNESSQSPNNPFLDYRLSVRFTAPDGHTYDVPGYYDGGNTWEAKFTPTKGGTWSYLINFDSGPRIALDPKLDDGTSLSPDGQSGTIVIAPRDPSAPGFLKHGILKREPGKFHYRFNDGTYFVKTGVNSPEDWLGYAGFDGGRPGGGTYGVKDFSAHIKHWEFDPDTPRFNGTPGDPEGKGIGGAINYLASKGINSIYFLPMNIGGDTRNTSPYLKVRNWDGNADEAPNPDMCLTNDTRPYNDDRHFDLSKLDQWEQFFTYVQSKGIMLHFVLGEAEGGNKCELDGATLGTERKLFYREMIARFGHHQTVQWNISEEYNYKLPISVTEIKRWAGYIAKVDSYDHPVAVHNYGDPDTAFDGIYGSTKFEALSVQVMGVGPAGGPDGENGLELEDQRERVAAAGRITPVGMDELETMHPTSILAGRAGDQRRNILWPTLLSGGNLEWYSSSEYGNPTGCTSDCKDPDDLALQDFTRYEDYYTYAGYAQRFMAQIPFQNMVPDDGLLSGESAPTVGGATYGGQVYRHQDKSVYAIYLPEDDSTGILDMTGATGDYALRWFNPRTGMFEGETRTVTAGPGVPLGPPPVDSTDWVALFEKP